jgi:thiol-disulfide isomerase/thioredoxin
MTLDRHALQAMAWALFAAFSSLAVSDDAEVVRGKVLDRGGKPIAGARVGSAFRLAPNVDNTDVLLGYERSSIVSNATGTFTIPAQAVAYTKALVAKGLDGSLGYVVRKGSPPIVIRLDHPGRLSLKAVTHFGSGKSVGVDLAASGSAVAYGAVEGGKADFVAPAGLFHLGISDPESLTAAKALSLKSAETQRVKVALQPASWVRNLGQPAPAFTPTDVQNAREGISPAQLRGKWVLVDFWATWCLPCIHEMPKLIEFYERHSTMRDRFEIIAVHSPDGKSLQAIQSAYKGLINRRWAGKTLPFPLVFDSTGNTQTARGVQTSMTFFGGSRRAIGRSR